VLTFSRKSYELHTKIFIYFWITNNESFHDSELLCFREVEVTLLSLEQQCSHIAKYFMSEFPVDEQQVQIYPNHTLVKIA